MSLESTPESTKIMHQREFILLSDKKEVESLTPIFALSPPSIQTFKHISLKTADILNKLAEGTGAIAVFGGIAAKGILWATGTAPLINLGMLVSYGVGASALMTFGAKFLADGAEPIENLSESTLESNKAKLREDVFLAAKKSGIVPDKFKDPIYGTLIEKPVAFSDDPTASIYDLSTVKELKERKIKSNPLVPSLLMDFSKLVYLPEVEKQIKDLGHID